MVIFSFSSIFEIFVFSAHCLIVFQMLRFFDFFHFLRRTPPPSAGPPKISGFFFSLSHPHFRSFSLSLSLEVFSLNFGGVFEGRDP